MALEVGSIFARLGARFDDDGFDKFDRRLDKTRRDARHGVTAHGKMDVDRRGFTEFDRHVKGAERSGGRLGGVLKGGLAVGAAGAGAGLIAVGLGARKAIGEFEEAAKVGAQTSAVIKSTGGEAGVSAKQVEDLATALSNKTGVDDEAIQSGENLLLTFTNVRNEAGKNNDIFTQATKVAGDMSAALGQDLKSSNIQLGKALNDPIKGITALSRVGVSFTKDQKEQIKTLTESGDRLGAQKLILAELNKEFKGSAEAQARPLERAKVAVNNLFESLGRGLAPAVNKVAGGLATFVGQLESGEGVGGRVRQVFGAIAGVVGKLGGAVGSAFGVIRSAFGGGDAQATKLGASIRSTFAGIVKTVRSVISSVVTQFRTLGPELEIIARRVGQLVGLLLAIFRRMLPAIRAIWKGVATVIRGVVEVISGILTLDFGKIADGFKHILSGLVRVAGGIIRGMTAPFREVMARIGNAVSGGVDAVVRFFRKLPGRAIAALGGLAKSLAGVGREALGALGRAVSNGAGDVVGYFKRLPGRIAGALGGLAGSLAGIARRAVGGFAKAFSNLPGAIAGALKGGGQFLGNIGRGIADWLNAHTPLGDKVKVGPISVRLPALARGGRLGNVGPSHGGARLFIAGEGGADEWVISQEGNRGANVRWAREALETLTGRRVALHAGGKRAKKKAPIKPTLSTGAASKNATTTARAEGGIKNFERDIARLERQYSQKDREYGMSEEEFVTETDDGAVINEEGVNRRLAELSELGRLREGIRKKIEDYKAAVKRVIDVYAKAKGRVTRALAKAKGGKRAKERAGYRSTITRYQTRINELVDLGKNLDLDLEDSRLDALELTNEADTLSPENRGKLLPAPAPAEGDVIDPGDGSDGSGAGGAGDGSGAGSTPTAPSAEDIARGVATELGNFNRATADLFGSFGGNFRAAGAPAPTAAAMAAGGRYFGAVDSAGGAGGAGGTNVTQIIQFAGPQPADPHTFTQASLHELRAAV